MIITETILRNFSDKDCKDVEKFAKLFPEGLDIGPLLGTDEEANLFWHKILGDAFLKKWVGWAILKGLIPAKIRANLSGANLREANLRGANLRGADLSEADLSEANLRWANLRGANLRGANLSEADLSEANLRWANLRGANLRWANLENSKR